MERLLFLMVTERGSDVAHHYSNTGNTSREDERTVFRLLVPTLACRKPVKPGVVGS